MKYTIGILIAVVVGMFVCSKAIAMEKLTSLKNKVMPSNGSTENLA